MSHYFFVQANAVPTNKHIIKNKNFSLDKCMDFSKLIFGYSPIAQ